MRKGGYAFIPLTVINSLIYIVTLWFLLYRLSPVFDKKLGAFATEIKGIGKFSVIWLCCNELAINVVWSVMDKMGFHNMVVEIIVVFVGLKVCEKLFTKTPLSVLAGIAFRKERS